jgi:hypothetical protein
MESLQWKCHKSGKVWRSDAEPATNVLLGAGEGQEKIQGLWVSQLCGNFCKVSFGAKSHASFSSKMEWIRTRQMLSVPCVTLGSEDLVQCKETQDLRLQVDFTPLLTQRSLGREEPHRHRFVWVPSQSPLKCPTASFWWTESPAPALAASALISVTVLLLFLQCHMDKNHTCALLTYWECFWIDLWFHVSVVSYFCWAVSHRVMTSTFIFR